MNKFMVGMALTLCIASQAVCGQDMTGGILNADGVPSAGGVPSTGGTSGSSKALPQACVEYINRTEACLARADPKIAGVFRQALDQFKSQLMAALGTDDAAQLPASCQEANEFFEQAKPMLKCE